MHEAERVKWYIMTKKQPCIIQNMLDNVMLKEKDAKKDTFCLNPFWQNVAFLYPLNTSENLWFSVVFRGYRNGRLG